MSVNSIVSEKYKSLEKLIWVPKKKNYSFFPSEEEGRGGGGGGGGGETRNCWGVLQKSIIIFGSKRASCKGLGQSFRALGFRALWEASACGFLFPSLLKERYALAAIQNCSIGNPPSLSLPLREKRERERDFDLSKWGVFAAGASSSSS